MPPVFSAISQCSRVEGEDALVLVDLVVGGRHYNLTEVRSDQPDNLFCNTIVHHDRRQRWLRHRTRDSIGIIFSLSTAKKMDHTAALYSYCSAVDCNTDQARAKL